MPMVIPVVAAFAAGAAGVSALGAAAAIGGIAGTVATVAAYATIAGAVMTGVGAITGSKDLMKIGAVLSIGGGLTGWAAGAAAGAAEGAGAASAEASMANAEGATPASLTGEAVATPVTSGAVPPVDATGVATVGGSAIPTPPGAVVTPESLAAPAPGTTTTTFTGLDTNLTRGAPPGVPGDYGSTSGAGAAGTTSSTDPMGGALSRVTEAGKALTQQDISSWWERAQQAGGSVAKFLQDNPALLKAGGDMLSSMYGPAAEKLDWEKSIYNRARANINAPVALSFKRG